jgi:hypothetical protein
MELERDVVVSPTAEVPVIEGELVATIRERNGGELGEVGERLYEMLPPLARISRRHPISGTVVEPPDGSRRPGVCVTVETEGERVAPRSGFNRYCYRLAAASAVKTEAQARRDGPKAFGASPPRPARRRLGMAYQHQRPSWR